jgi:hypothetical protein
VARLRAGRLKNSGSIPGRQKDFLFSETWRPAFAFVLELEPPACDAGHSHAFSAEVKIGWWYVLSSPYVFNSRRLMKTWERLLFSIAQQPIVGQGFLIIEASRSHSDTPHSVGLLWMSDQPDTETAT